MHTNDQDLRWADGRYKFHPLPTLTPQSRYIRNPRPKRRAILPMLGYNAPKFLYIDSTDPKFPLFAGSSPRSVVPRFVEIVNEPVFVVGAGGTPPATGVAGGKLIVAAPGGEKAGAGRS